MTATFYSLFMYCEHQAPSVTGRTISLWPRTRGLMSSSTKRWRTFLCLLSGTSGTLSDQLLTSWQHKEDSRSCSFMSFILNRKTACVSFCQECLCTYHFTCFRFYPFHWFPFILLYFQNLCKALLLSEYVVFLTVEFIFIWSCSRFSIL